MPSLALACRLSAVSRASRRPFSPASLFSSGEQGVWYDPSDFSTLFQDAAGTIPVTAVGQPVGKILDKSGRGNHATQTTVPKRPILKIDGNGKYYLEFDGIDDSLVTSSINFTSTDKMTVVEGIRCTVATLGVVVELSANAVSNAGSFMSAVNDFTYGKISFYLVGSNSLRSQYDFVSGTDVITLLADISKTLPNEEAILRINSIAKSQVQAIGGAGTGNFGNRPLYIGARNNSQFFFNGNLYSLIVRGAQSSEAQILSAETYCNQKTGAY